ncbi:molybdopterin molybdotransferase MoeA [Planctomycetota bacterium]|nr:molybdopterin molybdotransferase MoeA [Planctomycetota bacterium]
MQSILSNQLTFNSPSQAIEHWLKHIESVNQESVSLNEASGRVLATDIKTDRPSPACDVSAMDGYAVRIKDLDHEELPVAAEVLTGHAPPLLPVQAVLKIFTGGAVPAQADAVIPREHVHESIDSIRVPKDLAVKLGQNIRCMGENALANIIVLKAGVLLDPAKIAMLAAVGINKVNVYKRVRCALIITGNEVISNERSITQWQVRDSNGPALSAVFHAVPWIDWCGVEHVVDDPQITLHTCEKILNEVDALLITGGVSMGDHDYIPQVLEMIGAKTIFHRLPIRPGKPVLGAADNSGKMILALPGNPVSALTTARLFGVSALQHMAGIVASKTTPKIRILNSDQKKLSLHWSRPVQLLENNTGQLISTQGSGDIISLSHSDGFVIIPPGTSGEGPWPYYPWSID